MSDNFALNNKIQFGDDKTEDDVITAKPIRKIKIYKIINNRHFNSTINSS